MYLPIIATLGYVVAAGKVLLVHRGRAGDAHAGKWNGLGGKLERDEDIYSCLVRELREEAGITVTSARLRGTVYWPGFGVGGEDRFGFIFLVDGFEGTPPAANADGPLAWHEIDQLDRLPMWAGDRHFLPLVFGSGPMFHGLLPYEDGEPASWSYTET
ncbi:MAG TPA: 8-oxo-dGTP diphosphatase [Propionicimonas sp.]|nr:8-oxo-dGTP diphosphatase [Propionicimonas sp.]